MKRKILSLILVFAMTVSLLTVGTGAVEPAYGDTAGHWAESSIERWSGHGIIQGSNGLFDPNGQLTCAQLATILAKLLKLPAAKDAGFTDNTADAWYYDAVNRCAAAGILNGNGDSTVTPEAPITRERAMVMLGRALGIEPIREPDLTKYTDAAKVAPYAQGMVAAMIEAGIVGGVTADELAPQDNINRASTVTILDRAISTYADKAGATVKADGKGIVLVVADDVTVTGNVDKLLVPADNVDVTVSGSKNIDDITVTGDNSKVILNNSTANDVTLDGKNTELETKSGSKVENVSVTEDAKGATVNAGSGTTIGTVDSKADNVSISGDGKVENASVSGDNTKVNTKDTKVDVDEGVTGTTAGGKEVAGGTTTETKPSTPSGSSSSSGGSVHTHAYTTFVTNWNDMTTVRKCSCGATQTIENSNTHYIANDTDLKAFRNKVNAGEAFEGKTIELTKDISLAEEWAPIGNGSRSGSTYTGKAFKGIFDGKDKSISNVTITGTTANASDAIGLFGVVDGGTVKNVTLNVNINVVNNELAGGAIGLLVNGGKAEKIHVTGNVNTADGVGGIVGRMLISGTIKECVNEAVVDAAKAGSGCSGGIVGKAYYTATDKTMNIQDCENRGSITAAYCAGGIAGLSAANVSGCTNSGSVTAGNHAGGIVGEQTNYGAVSGNTNSAAVIGKTTAAGGIIGWVRYQKDESAYPNTALITVTGNTNSGSIGKEDGAGTLGYGGIVGTLYNQGTVSGNTNNALTITGGTFAAGIVGGPQKADNNKTIAGTVVTITNNVTKTAPDNITGTHKDLIAWKNEGDFVINNNSGTGWTVKIGEAQYTNLAAALTAAKDGDTVKLVGNISTDEGIGVAKKITLDMAGRTITSSVKQVFTVTGSGDLTITGNGTISGPAGEAAKALDGKAVLMVSGESAKLTVLNGTITAGGVNDCGMYGIYVADSGNVILGDADTKTGPTIMTWFAAVGENNTTSPANITIYGGEYTAQAAPAESDSWAYFCAPVYASASGDINIYGGTFNGYYGISSRYVNVGQNLNISGGTFNGSNSALFVDTKSGVECSETRTIAITGGTFSSNPSAYVAEGYIARENNGKYVVSMVGTAENPYTLNEFNALTKLPAGRTELYVDIGDVSLAGGDVTIGNKDICDIWTWDSNTNHTVGEILEDGRKVYMVRKNDTIYSSNKTGITLCKR